MMSAGWLLQIVIDVFVFVGLAVLWVRLRRPPQDDPRLSRGLQLLQSKISVLEDLSDRTDAQVKQLSHLIEQKARLLQNKIIESEHQISRVDQSMKRSKEVAEIFQDKIPHREIIERQDTIKYVKAAQLANSGKSIDEIATEVDLPIGQIELIAKLNKDQLVFDPEGLPEWARHPESLNATDEAGDFASDVLQGTTRGPRTENLMELFTPPAEEYSSLKKLGSDFREAVLEFERGQVPTPIVPPAITEAASQMAQVASKVGDSALMEGAKRMTSRFATAAGGLLNQVESKAKDFIDKPTATTATEKSSEVKKVSFPNVDVNRNLR